ncbi:MAG TPA: hypothetical protein VFM18_13855 [Methanosarcina sp.]|nr:hypothetical protein [Methanosarcina sp.]
MANVNQAVGTRTSLTISALSTLASATYAVSSTYTCNTNKPLDVIVEIDVATTNTPSGNKQLVVFIQESLDGTNFRSGPTSGTTTTDEPDLRALGIVPMNTATNTHTGLFSVAQVLGYVPYAFKIVVKNDLGVALTSGTAWTAEISGSVV